MQFDGIFVVVEVVDPDSVPKARASGSSRKKERVGKRREKKISQVEVTAAVATAVAAVVVVVAVAVALLT